MARERLLFETGAGVLLDHVFDRCAISKKRVPYERLDQVTMDILAGAR
jgi:hypothetical protein